MNRKHCALLFASALVLHACGDDDGSATADPDPAGATQAEAVEPPGPEGRPDPCALLTEEVVRGTFELPAETAVTHALSSNARYPVCAYTWPKPNADEIREEIAALQQERVRQMLKKARTGQAAQGMLDMAMNMPRLESQVSVNFGPESESVEAARSTFESAMSFLQEGLTHRVDTEHIEGATDRARAAVEGQEVTFQADVEEVEGIGDEARHVPRLNQLAIRQGRRILYITVEIEIEPADNLEHAKRLARVLLD